MLAVSFFLFFSFDILREKKSAPLTKEAGVHGLKILGAHWWKTASFGWASARAQSGSVRGAIPLVVAGPTADHNPVLQAASAPAVRDPRATRTAGRCPCSGGR